MKRRDFIGSSLAAGSAATGILRGAKTERSPNILLIMSDEHNRMLLGCRGNSLIRTPNLDRLASRGVLFENAYCNSPLCVPSRLSFTACKYPHRVSAWNNSCWIGDDNYPSLPHAMNAAGYQSYLCGKQHYDKTKRYGFTEIGGQFNNANHDGLGGRRDPFNTTVNHKAASARFAEFRTGDQSSVLRHDRAVTAGVLDFFKARTVQDKPFFLFAGYLAPHFPLTVPKDFAAHYDGKVGLPEIPAGFFESMPLNYKHLRYGFGLVDVPDEITKSGRQLYHGLTEWVDSEIGKVLSTLAASPFAENTIVIYTSDHGENMGEHGLWWKNCMYESAAHIPLIVSYPERWKGGQVRTGACSTVDVVKTVAELGKAHMSSDCNGDSLVSWLDDPKRKWKDLAVSEYYAHNIASGYSMLRAGDWKYVYHAAPGKGIGPERELYNLKSDPSEFENLAKDNANRHQVEKMHKTLLKELRDDPDETEQRSRAELARGYGRTDIPKVKAGEGEQD